MTPSSRFSEESHLCILRGVTRRDVLTATYELFSSIFSFLIYLRKGGWLHWKDSVLLLNSLPDYSSSSL